MTSSPARIAASVSAAAARAASLAAVAPSRPARSRRRSGPRPAARRGSAARARSRASRSARSSGRCGSASRRGRRAPRARARPVGRRGTRRGRWPRRRAGRRSAASRPSYGRPCQLACHGPAAGRSDLQSSIAHCQSSARRTPCGSRRRCRCTAENPSSTATSTPELASVVNRARPRARRPRGSARRRRGRRRPGQEQVGRHRHPVDVCGDRRGEGHLAAALAAAPLLPLRALLAERSGERSAQPSWTTVTGRRR